jgi:hypothetical protein
MPTHKTESKRPSLTPLLENIPAEIAVTRQWVLWRFDERGGKPTKLPYQVSGTHAKSNDFSTWTDLATVWRMYQRGGFSGIGFVFAKGGELVGIDLDDCRDPETGVIADWAQAIIAKLNTYAEVSPSRTGVKLWARGTLPTEKTGTKQAYESGAVELYQHGRYFCVTGHKLPDAPADIRPSEYVHELWHTIQPRKQGNDNKPVVGTHTPKIVGDDLDRRLQRAERYLARIPGAVSGQSGHDATFAVAVYLVKGFALTPDEAFPLMAEWNQSCVPPWSNAELKHKLEDAAKAECELGYLLNASQDRDEKTRTRKSTKAKTIATEVVTSFDLLSRKLPDAKPSDDGNWTSTCPACKSSEFRFMDSGSGRVLGYCQGGCAQGDIVAAVGFDYSQAKWKVAKTEQQSDDDETDDDYDLDRTVCVCLADVTPQPVQWLWPNRIALGKLTIISGNPGLGKSFLTICLAAKITQGSKWPDGDEHAPQGSVILLNCEDDLADTIRPRLDAAGADVVKVVAIQGTKIDKKNTRQFDLSKDLGQLEHVLKRLQDCRLVIVDPISAYCGDKDSHKNAEVRAMLAPLAELAARYKVAVVAVSHLRKPAGDSGGGAAIHATMGSIAWVAAARAAYGVVRDPEDPNARLFVPIKNNIGVDRGALRFELTSRFGDDGIPCVVWDSTPVNIDADEAINGPARKRGPKPAAEKECQDFLAKALASGPRAAKDIKEDAKDNDLSERTLARAKKSLGVESYRPEGTTGPVWWRLPANESSVPSFDENDTTPKQLGNQGIQEDFPRDIDDSSVPSFQDAKFPRYDDNDMDGVNAMLAEANKAVWEDPFV